MMFKNINGSQFLATLPKFAFLMFAILLFSPVKAICNPQPQEKQEVVFAEAAFHPSKLKPSAEILGKITPSADLYPQADRIPEYVRGPEVQALARAVAEYAAIIDTRNENAWVNDRDLRTFSGMMVNELALFVAGLKRLFPVLS